METTQRVGVAVPTTWRAEFPDRCDGSALLRVRAELPGDVTKTDKLSLAMDIPPVWLGSHEELRIRVLDGRVVFEVYAIAPARPGE